jgi:hypothetical protein
MRKPGRLLLLTVATGLLASLIAVTAVAAPQVPAPTLTGETFLGGLFTAEQSSVTVTSASCNPSGTSSFTYQASGPATGPYPGTYTETGTVTLGPQTIAGTPPNGIVTSWTASFRITSPTGSVTGSKSLVPNGPQLPGICTDNGEFFPQRSAATGFQDALAYTATITVSGGAQYSDHGFSDASVGEFPTFPPFNQFFEDFRSQQATTTLVCDPNSQGNQGQNGNNQGCQNP